MKPANNKIIRTIHDGEADEEVDLDGQPATMFEGTVWDGFETPKISDARRRWVQRTKTAHNHFMCETLGGVWESKADFAALFHHSPVLWLLP